jgi:hypothetical protein
MKDRGTSTSGWVEFTLWIAASLAGWLSGLALGALFTEIGSDLFGLNEDRALIFAVLVALGLACGDAQSVVLRRHLPGAWRWIPVTLAGYLLVVGIAAAAVGARLVSSLTTNVVLLALVGAAVGVPQWLLLRRHFRGAGWWAPASALGFLSFTWLVLHPAGSMTGFIATGTILGALSAVPTGIVLVWSVSRERRGTMDNGL